MDMTMLYNAIFELHGVDNMDKEYAFYYDETNNPRTFKLTDEGFNANERALFILGGLFFAKSDIPTIEEMNELISSFKLQPSMKEIKFENISSKSKNFLDLVTKKRVKVLIEWLFKKQYLIHYSFLDNFYYTIVDIVDSMEETVSKGFGFNRELKDNLYSQVLKHRDHIVKLLIEVDYPNVKDHSFFVDELANWIAETNVDNDFHLEYLRECLKQYKKKQLVFLEDNIDRVAIEGYWSLYSNSIVTYPKSFHLFDKEDVVEKKLKASGVCSCMGKN